jgi:hypothetical protein
MRLDGKDTFVCHRVNDLNVLSLVGSGGEDCLGSLRNGGVLSKLCWLGHFRLSV